MQSSKIKFTKISDFAPEQYEAFYGPNKVGYLRLRFNKFRIYYPSSSGELIYEAHTIGFGSFADSEKEFYLELAQQIIADKLTKDKMDRKK